MNCIDSRGNRIEIGNFTHVDHFYRDCEIVYTPADLAFIYFTRNPINTIPASCLSFLFKPLNNSYLPMRVWLLSLGSFNILENAIDYIWENWDIIEDMTIRNQIKYAF